MKKYLLLSLLLSVSLFGDNLLCSHPEQYIAQDKAQKSTYKNCLRNGMTWWFTEFGQIKSKVNFINGQENGLYTSYHDNGQEKIVVNYVDAQKDGVQNIYYDNAQLGSKVTYNMGRREGLMIDWDRDGYKSAEVFYKHNYKVGLKKYFNHAGDVIMTETYKMDRNPVMVKLLKDKRKEIMIDLSKYGLVPKSASKEERMK